MAPAISPAAAAKTGQPAPKNQNSVPASAMTASQIRSTISATLVRRIPDRRLGTTDPTLKSRMVNQIYIRAAPR